MRDRRYRTLVVVLRTEMSHEAARALGAAIGMLAAVDHVELGPVADLGAHEARIVAAREIRDQIRRVLDGERLT